MHKIVRVYSDRFNHTCIQVKCGDIITITPDMEQVWRDNAIPADATGWDIPLLHMFSCLRDVPSCRLMTLCGAIGKHRFGIGKGLTWVATEAGEIVLFANDVWWMRWNNTGFIDVTVDVKSGESEHG